MTVKDRGSEILVFITVASTPVGASEIIRLVSHILRKLRVSGSVSIHCIGDTRMRSLNSQYRGKHSTTDVLTFPLHEGESVFTDTQELGDIFLSVAQIERQARDFNISPREEFIRMLVHGVLHILGYDHVAKKEARQMFALQEKLLFELL